MHPDPYNAVTLTPITGGGHPPARTFPPVGWPSRDALLYVRDLASVVLLLIAAPFLVHLVVRRPADVVRAVAR